MIKHSQSTQMNKFAISLQYLDKEVSEGVHFLNLDKHQTLYKLALFWRKWPDMSKVPQIFLFVWTGERLCEIKGKKY